MKQSAEIFCPCGLVRQVQLGQVFVVDGDEQPRHWHERKAPGHAAGGIQVLHQRMSISHQAKTAHQNESGSGHQHSPALLHALADQLLHHHHITDQNRQHLDQHEVFNNGQEQHQYPQRYV